MDDRTLLQILAAEEKSAVGYYDSTLSKEQRTAIDYYLGDLFGDERDGYSKVVSQDVAEVVDWRLPSLLRIFFAGDVVAEFEPSGPEDVEAAKQATEYIHYIFTKDNPGFQITHDWFKDALLSKVGVVKVWWDESEKKAPEETLTGLSVMQVQDLMNDDAVEIVGQNMTPTEFLEGFPDGLVYDLTIRRTKKTGKVCIEGVPPEEFLISRRAKTTDAAAYTAHRTRKTISDLIAMGFDRKTVMDLPIAAESHISDREDDRFEKEDPSGRVETTIDPMMREVWLLEEYVRTDYDDDGYAELRQVFRVDTKILEHAEVDCNPWAGLCPYPFPHKFYGQGDAEKVMDIQRIKSALWRQSLDNLYISNNPMMELPEAAERTDGSTMEALTNPQIGGVILTRAPGMLNPIALPFTASAAFTALEYADTVREQRSGVSRFNQGLEADTLNKTATGIGKIMDAGKDRTELIARIFAETGVKTLFRKILRLITKYQDKPRMIRLRNQWVEMDPRHWNADMDAMVNVGLGTGNKDQNLIHLESIFQKQALLHQSGQVPIEYPHVYETVSKMVENMGIKNPERFFPDPNVVGQQEEGPSPEQQRAMAELQIEQMKAQADIELQQQKAAAQLEIEREKAALQAQLAREKAAAEMMLARERMAFEQELAAQKIQTEAQLASYKATLDGEAKLSAYRPGGDLDK